MKSLKECIPRYYQKNEDRRHGHIWIIDWFAMQVLDNDVRIHLKEKLCRPVDRWNRQSEISFILISVLAFHEKWIPFSWWTGDKNSYSIVENLFMWKGLFICHCHQRYGSRLDIHAALRFALTTFQISKSNIYNPILSKHSSRNIYHYTSV